MSVASGIRRLLSRDAAEKALAVNHCSIAPGGINPPEVIGTMFGGSFRMVADPNMPADEVRLIHDDGRVDRIINLGEA